MSRVILASPGFHGRAAGGRLGGRVIPVAASGAAPSLGVHTNVIVPVGTPNDPVVTPSITTQTGSLLIACVGRGNLTNFTGLTGATPHDNKGNPNYTQVGSVEAYSPPNQLSGTALYKLVGAAGGAGYQVSVAQGLESGNNDEVTILLCEILGGSLVQDFSWIEDTASHPTTSGTVTTTGPALLVATWWGEGASFTSATVDSSFSVIETVPVASNGIQAAMAVRQVSSPGTYSVTWTASPSQGAQMWLAAVQ